MIIDQNTYRQAQVPTLHRVLSIKQPVDDVSLQYWDHIVSFLEIQKQIQNNHPNQSEIKKSLVQLLIFKGKQGNIVIWRFENGCVLFQRSIKINHAIQKQITTLKTYILRDLDEKKSQAYILVVGYFDGVLQIYEIKIQQSQIALLKYLMLKNTNQEPVRDIAIHNQSDMFVCRCHVVYMYPKIIQDVGKKILSKSKQPILSSQTLLKLSDLSKSSKISISISDKSFHIYNQIQGNYTFSLPQMENSGSIIDSIKLLIQTQQEDIILSAADDSLKILYAQNSEVQLVTGLKSFVSSIIVNQLRQERLLQMWIGDMYGQIHYMIKQKKRIVSKGKKQLMQQRQNNIKVKNSPQLVIFQQSFTKGIKICQNGIKKLLIGTNLMIVVDTQMNIIIYDIIRKIQNLTGRQTQR